MPDGGTPLARRNLGVPDAGCNLRRGQSASRWQKLRRPAARRRRSRPVSASSSPTATYPSAKMPLFRLMLPPVVTTGRVSPGGADAEAAAHRRAVLPEALLRSGRQRPPVAGDVGGARQVGVQGHDQRLGQRGRPRPARTCRGSCRREVVLGGLELRLEQVAAGEPQLHLAEVQPSRRHRRRTGCCRGCRGRGRRPGGRRAPACARPRPALPWTYFSVAPTCSPDTRE